MERILQLVAPASLKAIAGVANIGTDVNWCGHTFAQANWYAFGRLAWQPTLSAEEIADEWLKQTFDLILPGSQLSTLNFQLKR